MTLKVILMTHFDVTMPGFGRRASDGDANINMFYSAAAVTAAGPPATALFRHPTCSKEHVAQVRRLPVSFLLTVCVRLHGFFSFHARRTFQVGMLDSVCSGGVQDRAVD